MDLLIKTQYMLDHTFGFSHSILRRAIRLAVGRGYDGCTHALWSGVMHSAVLIGRDGVEARNRLGLVLTAADGGMVAT